MSSSQPGNPQLTRQAIREIPYRPAGGRGHHVSTGPRRIKPDAPLNDRPPRPHSRSARPPRAAPQSARDTGDVSGRTGGRGARDARILGVRGRRARLQGKEAAGTRLPRLQHPGAPPQRLPRGGARQPGARPGHLPRRPGARERPRRGLSHRAGRDARRDRVPRRDAGLPRRGHVRRADRLGVTRECRRRRRRPPACRVPSRRRARPGSGCRECARAVAGERRRAATGGSATELAAGCRAAVR